MSNDLGITEKGKFGQFWCPHKNKKWFTDHSYTGINGQKQVRICTDCSKKTTEFIALYEGNGFK